MMNIRTKCVIGLCKYTQKIYGDVLSMKLMCWQSNSTKPHKITTDLFCIWNWMVAVSLNKITWVHRICFCFVLLCFVAIRSITMNISNVVGLYILTTGIYVPYFQNFNNRSASNTHVKILMCIILLNFNYINYSHTSLNSTSFVFINFRELYQTFNIILFWASSF